MSRTRLLEPAAALIVESSKRQHLSMRCRFKRPAPLEGLSLIVERWGALFVAGRGVSLPSPTPPNPEKPSLVDEADFDEGSLLTELALCEL
jgi:hypothetical protein